MSAAEARSVARLMFSRDAAAADAAAADAREHRKGGDRLRVARGGREGGQPCRAALLPQDRRGIAVESLTANCGPEGWPWRKFSHGGEIPMGGDSHGGEIAMEGR